MILRKLLIGRAVLRMFAVALCCSAPAAPNGAQQIDSGWAVSQPPTAVKHTSLTLPRRTTISDDLLRQTMPWLTKDSAMVESRTSRVEVPWLPGQPPKTPWGQRETGSPLPYRFAVRPDGIDGWRPAGQSFVSHGDWQAPAAIPREETETTSPNPEVQSLQSSVTDTSAAGAAHPGVSAAEVAEDASDEMATTAEAALSSVDESPLAEEATQDASDKGMDEPPLVANPSAPPPLTPQLVKLRSRVRGVLNGYYRKTLNSRDHDPWEVMHGMLSYELQSRILQGGPRGAPITAVGWLCYNKPCKGQTLLYVTPQGELRAKYGVGVQGHLGQFLAMLAQCGVSPEYPIRVGKKEFTIYDLIEAEKKTCYPKSELTFKLIAFQYYLDLNEKWLNDQGSEWDIPRLIREELAQPIRGAACGGTHRLSGLSLTVNTRLRRGEPLDGEYARAAEFVKKHQQYAFRLQNRDGSLSTAWFQGRGDDPDINRRIKTTGHILEWLCYSLTDEELRQPPTVRAVSYLANLMYSKYNNEWEVGPMCHAIHALLVYDERVFQPFDGPNDTVAYRPRPATASRKSPASGRRR